MAKTIVGLFDSMNDAHKVVQELIDTGISRNDISLVANDSRGEYSKYGKSTTTSTTTTGDVDAADRKTAEGAGAGAVGGTVVGGVLGLLVGVGALAIPGVGPVIAAGQLATVLGSTALGAGIGAAAGGLIGALVNLGVPEDEANYYAEGVRRGGTLVTVKADDNIADRAYSVMQRYGAVDIKERGAQWQQSGWQSFDPNAQPYSSDEIDQFRSSYTTRRTGTDDQIRQSH